MRNYSMGPMEGGDTLALHLGSQAAMFDGDNLLIVYTFAGILLAILAVVMLVNFVQRRRMVGIVHSTSGDNQEEYQAIVKAIAALDDAYGDGDLTEDAYRQRRTRLKDQALNFMRRDDD